MERGRSRLLRSCKRRSSFCFSSSVVVVVVHQFTLFFFSFFFHREREKKLFRVRSEDKTMPSTTVGTLAPAAVVLAGERSGALYPLDAFEGSGGGLGGGIAASSSSSSPLPPLLLPLAGAPLISYPLRALEAAGVRKIIVVSAGG